jgi:hypothetical protein
MRDCVPRRSSGPARPTPRRKPGGWGRPAASGPTISGGASSQSSARGRSLKPAASPWAHGNCYNRSIVTRARVPRRLQVGAAARVQLLGQAELAVGLRLPGTRGAYQPHSVSRSDTVLTGRAARPPGRRRSAWRCRRAPGRAWATRRGASRRWPSVILHCHLRPL